MDPTILGNAKVAASLIADSVKSLVGLAAKLRKQPDDAAIHMQRALAEIGRTCQVMDDAIVSFAELIDDPSVGTIVRLRGGGLAKHVSDGLGHCHVVKNVYDRFLDKWFARVFGNANDYIQIKSIFDIFERGDKDLFYWIGKLAVELQNEATEILPLLRAGKSDLLRSRVWQVLDEIAPVQVEMNRITAELMSLKAELIATTRAIPPRP